MKSLYKLVLFSFVVLLLAACGFQPEASSVTADQPETAVTIIYVTATPKPKPPATLTPTPAPSLELPKIHARQPNAQRSTDRQPTITLHFRGDVEADTIAAALRVAPFLPTEVTVTDRTAVIQLLEPMAFDTTYQFSIGGPDVVSSGVYAERPYTWNLSLKEPLARISGQSTEHPDLPLTLYFNYAMDEASVSQALSIKPDVRGKLAWSNGNKQLTFTPDERLEADTSYTVSFQGDLRDRDGQVLAQPPPFSFTTPPPILSHTPQSDNANPLSPLEIRFDRLMDEAATEAALQIDPPVEGSFSWFETTLRFRPSAGFFDENSSYTVTVDATAVSADGDLIMDEPLVWSFTTRTAPEIANFGYGPNAQVLDVNGRRAVQFRMESQDTLPLGFELYRLDLTQFLERYSSNFTTGGDAGRSDAISTADAELVKSWQMETAVPQSQESYAANVQELIIPADVEPGLYILNLTAGRLNDQLILVLTENTIAVKQAEEQIVAWVTEINGDHAPGIPVGVYARNGDRLAQGVTDDEGIFRTQLQPFAEGGPPAIEPLIVVAQNGDDITVSGLSPEWQSDYGSGSWWQRQEPSAQAAAFIHTDRPIYKPGQDVYFKAVVRLEEDAVLANPPAATPVTIRIRDARDNIVQTYELTTNDFGTVNGAFSLADEVMLGDYAVELIVDETSQRQIFKVEDYRKPDYEVTLTTDADTYLLGEEIEVTVDTAYYFGEPVPNAEVVVRRFEQTQYWNEQGRQTSWYEPYDSAENQKTYQTDENGRLTFTMPIPTDTYLGDDYYYGSDWGSNLESVIWGIEATVDDGSHQTVSGFASVTLYDQLEEIVGDSGGYVQEPGRPFIISAEVDTIYGEPVADRALTVELTRWQHSSGDYSKVVQTGEMVTDENGRSSTPFTIAEPGYYQLRFVSEDAQGHHIRYSDYVYAFSDFYGSWAGSGNGELVVNVAADSYAPGDTAQILVESTFDGPALLTVERGTTRREQLVQLTSPLTVIDLPIEETDVPNVYVAINAWREQEQVLDENTYESLPDGRLLTASTNVSVPADNKRLTVTITPDKAQYAPREEATFTVRVTNYRGEPVSAELSLALVDEAIFALSPELSGPMYDAFYYERVSIVRTYNSLRPMRHFYGGGMGGGGGNGLTGGPRADFPDTATWLPILYTDANGETQVTVTLPDSLTTWRMTAKAATTDTQVGETLANITTWQPIIVRPLLPRQLTAGDTAVLSAIVHNYSDAPQTLTVTLAITESLVAIDAAAVQTITVPAAQSRIVGWPVTALAAGEGDLVVTAVTPVTATSAMLSAGVPDSDLPSDAIQLPLTVQPLAVPDVHTKIGQFTEPLRTSVTMPADALPMSYVEVQLSRSIAGTLLEGLEYLTGYPYGCVEQTMSKALPNAVVGRALNQLGVTNPTLQAELPAYINASVQRLYGFQHNDGGWGWWFDDATHDYQTAWVIFGLAQVAEAGYEVDSVVIERGAVWLNDNLGRMDARTRAFALYALAEAGQPNTEATLNLAADLDALQGDTFSLAGLALALDAIGEDELAGEIVDGLAETAVTNNNNQTHWQGAAHDGHYSQKTMASDVRNTALALSAFTQIRPGHELEGGIVRWLMAQRRSEGWGSTNETSFAILGLTDHLLAAAFSEAAATTGYTLSVNGAVVDEGVLGRNAPAVTVRIPQEQLAAGSNEIVIAQDGERPLYYTINSRSYLAQAEIEAAGGVKVKREYLDPQSREPLESIIPGQLVLVRLTVDLPEDGSYMIVEDKLPAGLEALNEGLNITSRIADDFWMHTEDKYAYRNLGYNYKEIWGDRVSFFITEMEEGEHTFKYMTRATMPGQFTAMPAEVVGMYNPALWGRSASDLLVVEEEE